MYVVCASCAQEKPKTLIECVSLWKRRPSATRNGFRTKKKNKRNEKCSYCRSSSDICFGTSTKCCSSHSDLWSSVCYFFFFISMFCVALSTLYYIISFLNGIVFALPFDLCGAMQFVPLHCSSTRVPFLYRVFAPLLRSYDYSFIV